MTDRGEQKIAVLAGGNSCEREISLISGRAVFDALLSKGLDVVLMDPVAGFIEELRRRDIQMVFLALHGSFGEDGTIQTLLEKEGIKYTGPGVEASRKAFDKSEAQRIFHQAGILVPPFLVLKKGESIPLPAQFDFPLVIKPASCGSSVGISILLKRQPFEKAILDAFNYSDTVMIEKYITGRELTVGILGDKALPIVEVLPGRKFYDYEAKYKECGTRYEFPAKLDPSSALLVSEAALSAYRALGCEVMSRVDVIFGEDKLPYVLEINTIPGLTGKSLLPKAAKASGIDFPDLCVKILELSDERMSAKIGSYGKTVKN